MSKRLIEGFDYTTRQEVRFTQAQWQERIAKAVADGGRRRAEGGETFIHGKNAHILAEIYAIIPAPGAAG